MTEGIDPAEETYYQLTSAQGYGFGGFNNVNVRVIEETEDRIRGVVVGKGNSVSPDGDEEITVTKDNIAAWKEVEPVDLQAAVERSVERQELTREEPDADTAAGPNVLLKPFVAVIGLIGIVSLAGYFAGEFGAPVDVRLALMGAVAAGGVLGLISIFAGDGVMADD